MSIAKNIKKQKKTKKSKKNTNALFYAVFPQ